MTMDAVSEASVNSFFSQSPIGAVDVTMAGDPATHRMPASLSEVSSFVSWNMPSAQVSMAPLKVEQVIDMDGGIDLSSIGGIKPEPGPQVGGPNLMARKPSNPGFS